jgi:hypothetical protein
MHVELLLLFAYDDDDRPEVMLKICMKRSYKYLRRLTVVHCLMTDIPSWSLGPVCQLRR